MDDLTLKKLEEAFSIDSTVEEACFYADISHQTYYNWVESFPKLKERFDSLRNKPVLKARQEVVKGLDGNPEFSLKYLERKKKQEFSPRTEMTGADGKDLAPVDFNDPKVQAAMKAIDETLKPALDE